MNFKSEVEVCRSGHYPAIMKIEIKDNNLKVKIDKQILFIDLCRYVIDHTPILETNYIRTCPYKLRIEKTHKDGAYSHRTYIIDFLELKNNVLTERLSNIISLNGCNDKVGGDLDLFIPDFLLVLKEREYISISDDLNFCSPKRKFTTEVEYKEICRLISPEELKRKGFVVPKSYEKTYAKLG